MEELAMSDVHNKLCISLYKKHMNEGKNRE